jgi:intracellular sulfur oxidation DsrE/DsrF family protein
MNNFMYKEQNADIPVIYIGMSIHILVKRVKRNSVRRVV